MLSCLFITFQLLTCPSFAALFDLGETSLSGSLPSEVGMLTSLGMYMIGIVSFDSCIVEVTDVFRFTNTETLWLDMCLMGGNVPTQIGLATNLGTRSHCWNLLFYLFHSLTIYTLN